MTYDDGQGLQLRCIYERYADSAAAEWTLWLENTADSDSRPIKNILPLDIAIDVPSAPITVSYPRGTTGSIEDFKLKQDRLEEVLRYETCGSRGEVMPFSVPKRLQIRTFGNFEVLYDNTPLRFKYQKTKEMLAYLVDRNGSMCSTGELMLPSSMTTTTTPTIKDSARICARPLQASGANL